MFTLPILLLVALGVLSGLFAADAGPAAVALTAVWSGALLLAPRGPRIGALRVFALAAFLGAAAGLRARAPPSGDDLSRGLGAEPVRLSLSGTIVSSDPATPDGTSLVLDVEQVVARDGARDVVARSKVFVAADAARAPPEVLPGDRVVLFGLVAQILPATNPGAYDAAAAAARTRVFSRTSVPDPRCLEIVRHADGPLAGLAWLRNRAANGLDATLGARDGGLVRSLLLGDRGTLDPADRRRFREAGASHILAISGAHVAILVASLLWLLRRCGCSPRPAAGIVLVLVVLFVPFTGSAPPVVRSAAGFVLWLAGRLLGLEPTGGVVLATVASTYLVLDPAAVGDPGFRMSFAAAAGLLLLAGRIHRALVPERPVLPGIAARPKSPVRSAVAVGIAAWLGSTPVAVHDLAQMSWIAVPVGIVAVPLSTCVMLFAAVALLLAPLPVAGPAARLATEGLLAALRWFLDLPAAADVGTFSVVSPDGLWYVAYLAAFVAAARGGRASTAAGGVALLLLLASLSSPAPREPPPYPRLTLLDVGHGQAALLETPDGATALLDAGSRDRPEPATRIVLPALRALGVTSLTLACASHADSDHAGALAEVLEEIPADLAVAPPRFPPALLTAIASHGASPITACDGDVLLSGSWGRLTVLGPAATVTRRTSTNDGCLVLMLETPQGRLLLSGDRETAGVEALLLTHPDLAADVLVLPHHGHASVGRDRLMRACGARVLLSSAPPNAAAVQPPGTRVTGIEGALAVELRPDGPRVVPLTAGSTRAVGGYDSTRGAPRSPMAESPTLLAAAVLLLAIALAATRLRWLTAPGAGGAALLGFAAVAAFSWAGLLALLAPFLVATLLGKLPAPVGGGPAEGPRSLKQVASNGVPALPGIALAFLGHAPLGGCAFVGALAALGADTVATEMGTRYGGTPRHVLSGKPLARGESGGVTWLGSGASLLGACLAPLAFAAAGGLAVPSRSLPYVVAMLSVAGWNAGLLDSVLGAALQRKGTCPTCGTVVESAEHCGVTVPVLPRRWSFLDNDAVNVANGIAGAALGAYLPTIFLR